MNLDVGFDIEISSFYQKTPGFGHIPCYFISSRILGFQYILKMTGLKHLLLKIFRFKEIGKNSRMWISIFRVKHDQT